MDPLTLATTAAAFLSPYLVKASDKAVEEVGKMLPAAVGKMWQAITLKFKDKPAAQEATKDLVTKPDDQLHQSAFANQLRKVLEVEPMFATELERLLANAQNEAGDTIINIGSGAIAQGPGAVAVGERGVATGGDVRGSIIITGSVSGEGKVPGGSQRLPHN